MPQLAASFSCLIALGITFLGGGTEPATIAPGFRAGRDLELGSSKPR
jgi:hypothetical protein